jgi:hypothetical protein
MPPKSLNRGSIPSKRVERPETAPAPDPAPAVPAVVPLSAFGSGFGGQAAAVGPFSSGELKEDDVTRLLNVCFDVQKQIYKIKEFMFQFCTAIEREKKQNDQTKSNTDGDVGTSTVSDCIQQAISMMSGTDGEIKKLQEMVSKMHGEPKKPPLVSLITDAHSFFQSLMRKSDGRSFLVTCLNGVTKLTAILDYASDICDHFLDTQKKIQVQQERQARDDSKSREVHAAAQHEIHASVSIGGQNGLSNTSELLRQYMTPCSDDDDWMTSSSSSASAQSSRLSCETEISIDEVVGLYDDTCMLLQITSDLQELSAALLMTDDIPRSEELKYKTHLVDRAISGLTNFSEKSRKDTRKIANAADENYWLRNGTSGAQSTVNLKSKNRVNPRAKAQQRTPGDDSDDSDGSYATSISSSVDSRGSAVSKPVDETENMALQLDMLIPKERLVVNIETANEMEKVKKERLSKVFKQIKAPNFSRAHTEIFLTILHNLVTQGKVHDSQTSEEIKPLKLLIESDGTKTVGLSESFMDAKAQNATRFQVELSWLREYVLRLKVDGMHDAQRASSGGASSGGDEEDESCFFKIFSTLNKKSAATMASRISDPQERREFTSSPFFDILQNPPSQFETFALRAMEERVIQHSQPNTNIAQIDKPGFYSEGNGRLCIDNASTLDMSVIGAERLGMFSTLLDGGASNDCKNWIFGPRNCIYYADHNGTILTLHICEIVTFKNGVYCINICIEITESRRGSSSREHRYRTIHTLPLCDVTGQFKETFTPIELNKVCVLWNGMIDDVANGLMQHNALKMLGPNMLKAVGDETQLWDTLISVFLKNGGLLPYYLDTTNDGIWHTYNQFVTKFNEHILGTNFVATNSGGENELIELFMTIAKQIAGEEGKKCIEFIHTQCMKIILASNDRLNHAGTAHFHLGTMGCPTVLGHLQHRTKYENPHWKSLLTCCEGRVLAADARSMGIVIRACAPAALGVTPTRRTKVDKDLVSADDESSVASGPNSSSIVSRAESVNLKLLQHFPVHRVYARQHAQIIANRSGLVAIDEVTINEIEEVLTKVDESLPNSVFSALEIHKDDNDFHSVSGVNESQNLGSQLTPPHEYYYEGPVEGQGPVDGQGLVQDQEPVKHAKRFGGSTKQVKKKSMKRKRSNSKKFPTKKKRQSKKKNTIKKGNNNVNIKHKNKTKKNKKINIR